MGAVVVVAIDAMNLILFGGDSRHLTIKEKAMTDAPDDMHNTNPLAPARLTIQIETSLGPRTVITSAIDRVVASAIVDALAGRDILAAVHDDRGSHTVKDLVRRKLARERRQAVVAAAARSNVSPIRKVKT